MKSHEINTAVAHELFLAERLYHRYRHFEQNHTTLRYEWFSYNIGQLLSTGPRPLIQKA
jgi:hypothetical protein